MLMTTTSVQCRDVDEFKYKHVFKQIYLKKNNERNLEVSNLCYTKMCFIENCMYLEGGNMISLKIKINTNF